MILKKREKIIKCWLTDRLDAVGVFVTLCSIRAENYNRANVAQLVLAYTIICFYKNIISSVPT